MRKKFDSKMVLIRGLYLLTLLFLSIDSKSQKKPITDTTIIEFSDKHLNKKVTVLTAGNKEIELPVTLNLENLLNKLGIDSAGREEALFIIGESSKRDTLMVISKNGDKIQIITNRAEKKAGDNSDKTLEMPKQLGSKEEVETQASKRKSSRFFSKSDFGFYIGLNNYKNGNSSNPSQLHNLRTWKSRYISFSLRKNATLLKGEKADLALSYGPEFAFYNFRFENSNTIFNENGQTSFQYAGFDTQKSKLTLPYINFPVLLNVGFKNEKFKLGFGGYAGYRIGAYTKTKDLNGNKEKIKNNYNLNNLLYGLTAELGRKNGLTLFFRHDLNELFQDGQINATGLKAFSFGLRL